MVAAVPGETAVMKRSAKRREEELALGLRLAEVGVLDRGDGLGRVADPGRALTPRREERGVVGVLREVPRQPAPALPAEPAHPAGHVGGEPRPGLLAVVADVDPDGELAVDRPAHGGVGLAGERPEVDRLAAVLADQEVPERRRPGQAPDVGRQDAILAALHRALRARVSRP
jgi:hypothetical protein